MNSRNVLPAEVRPSEYWLHIIPNFTDFTFTGRVKIHLHATADTSLIKLNALELSFTKVSLVKKDPYAASGAEGEESHEIPLHEVVMDNDAMTATLPLAGAAALRANTDAHLCIDFTGTMNDKLVGFYRSQYKTPEGREVWLATTQFEAVEARRAFPCWDEPAHKAIFHITITAPSHMACLSNTHVVEETPGAASDGAHAPTTTYRFAPTPKMSSYLVAWTIGELEATRTTLKLPLTPTQDTLLSVYVPLGRLAQASFALDVAARVLPLYERFFGHAYGLRKLDLVAIPDFAAGAMENWGLVTYRESALLCDENSSVDHRQRVAIVVCHELAHQWFGNLVTMEWWSELWLNEAFATYMQYWAAGQLFPEWGVQMKFAWETGSSALQLDALRNSHAVEVEVRSAQEVDEIFDDISYSKGSRIVLMIIEFIGAAAFQRGIAAYIQHFQYGNARTVDLWRFLGEAAGKNLAPVMEHWTGRQGYPLLRVTQRSAEDTASAAAAIALTMTQSRFLISGAPSKAEDATVWKIPLLLHTPDDAAEQQVMVDQRTVTVEVRTSSWVKLNSRQSAFCRVWYDKPLLNALIPAIREKKLSGLDRLNIIADYAAFACSGCTPTNEVLQLMREFSEQEEELAVWLSIANFEGKVRFITLARGDEAVKKLNAYSHALYKHAMKRVGYTPQDGEPSTVAQLRALLFDQLTTSKLPEALEAARNFYANRNEAPIPADLHKAVFAVRAREGGAAAVAEIKGLIATTTDAMERTRYLYVLSAGSPDAISVPELFDYCFSDQVRAQDALFLLHGIASNPLLSTEFARGLIKNWGRIRDALPGMLLARCIGLVEYCMDANVMAELRDFWETQVSETDRLVAGRCFQQAIEGAENKAAWAQRDTDAILHSL